MEGQSPEALLRYQRPQREKFEVQRRSDILKAAEKLSTLYRSRGAITQTVDRELVCHQIQTHSPTNSFRDSFLVKHDKQRLTWGEPSLLV